MNGFMAIISSLTCVFLGGLAGFVSNAIMSQPMNEAERSLAIVVIALSWLVVWLWGLMAWEMWRRSL